MKVCIPLLLDMALCSLPLLIKQLLSLLLPWLTTVNNQGGATYFINQLCSMTCGIVQGHDTLRDYTRAQIEIEMQLMTQLLEPMHLY